MFSTPEKGFTHLTLKYSTLKRIPSVAKSSLVCSHSLLVVRKGLSISSNFNGAVSNLEKIVLSLFPILGLSEVIGQKAIEFFKTAGKQFFKAFSYSMV